MSQTYPTGDVLLGRTAAAFTSNKPPAAMLYNPIEMTKEGPNPEFVWMAVCLATAMSLLCFHQGVHGMRPWS